MVGQQGIVMIRMQIVVLHVIGPVGVRVPVVLAEVRGHKQEQTLYVSLLRPRVVQCHLVVYQAGITWPGQERASLTAEQQLARSNKMMDVVVLDGWLTGQPVMSADQHMEPGAHATAIIKEVER